MGNGNFCSGPINRNGKIYEKKLGKSIINKKNGDWGLGIGDWGLGIGPIPNPHIHKLETKNKSAIIKF